jgi:2-succinyl-5-enolpyruvyl-6-hydroxy-3-cyclohexene-1-carboxylate synthase
MTVDGASLQASFAATFVDEWARAGVRDAVVAPGSRSTPLALALAADDRMRLHVHLDERAAAFFALGIGLASGRPAVVLTTSGTAAVELHPAVVEASLARVPLLACTADRPPELHHVGAPQTVEQSQLFAGVVRWSVEPGPADAVPVTAWRSLASRAVVEATCGPLGPGPVHLNLAFRDPLVGVPGELPLGRSSGRPWHTAVAASASPVVLPDGFAGRRGVVVAGGGCDVDAVLRLARALSWPVLADPRSGCRGAAGDGVAVAAFDGLLRVGELVAALRPDVVLRVGAPPASKALSEWLTAMPLDVEQVVVDPHGRWPDPERRAAVRLPAVPLVAGDVEPCDASWLAAWQRAERAAQAAIDATLAPGANADAADGGVTEPGTLRAITRDTPADATLFVSSSMPIRDIEWFGHPSSTHRVLANRGANGIDGVVATALGVAAAADGPVVAVVGDLAFLYDSSALLWAAQRDVDLTIVVVDNDGGGIFSFLPQRTGVADDRFESLFGTPHGVDIEALAAVHGMRIVHVRTERDANVAVHAELNAAIAAAVRSVL